MERKIAELERRIALLEEQMTSNHRDVLRVKGLIVEDSDGNERILVGSPVPSSDKRVRKDNTTSIVFLDEEGIDRLVIGTIPDPQMNGKVVERMSTGVGMSFNDNLGNERGGIGIFENGIVGMAFDFPTGREAVGMFVMPEEGPIIEMSESDSDKEITIAPKDLVNLSTREQEN